MVKKNIFLAYSFLFPAILLVLFIYLIPFILNLFLSFTDWKGVGWTANFIAFKNYIDVFKSHNLLVPFLNTLKFAAITVILQNIIALTLAVLLNEKSIITTIARVVVFIPTITNTVAVGRIWQFIFNPIKGSLKTIFENMGLDFLANIRWIGDPRVVLYSLILVSMWQWFGWNFILYSAGLQNIPEEINEASSIDGASSFSRFTRITLPLLIPTFTINIVLTTIGSLKVFELPYIMTGGGPGRASETFIMAIIQASFLESRIGFGSALTFLLFIVIFAISIVQNKTMRKIEDRIL